MSDNPTTTNGHDAILKLRIELSYTPQTGDFHINGTQEALGDQLVFYGMLELAKRSYEAARRKASAELAYERAQKPLVMPPRH